MSAPLRAVVLAAGHGSRLQPLTDRLAKPALPFVGVPILTRLLDNLAAAGVTEVLINLHHAADSVRDVVSARGGAAPSVSWSDETELLLGTGGALMAMRDELLRSSDDGDEAGDFLLLNGDCIHDLDYQALLAAHRESGASATLAVLPRALPPFGSLLMAEDGQVRVFGSPTRGAPDERHFLSVQVLSPRLLETLPEGPPRPLGTFSDWYPEAQAKGHVFRVFEVESEWHAVDTRERYLEATADWLRRREGGPFLGEGVSVADDARVDEACALHARCSIGARSDLQGSVLLEGVQVEEDVSLKDCLVGPGVRIARGSTLQGEILSVASDAAEAS